MKKLTIKPETTIRQSLKYLTKGGEKCLIVVNEENTFLGTLSDGDLRKSILNGSNMGDSIHNIYNNKPTVLVHGEYGIDEAKKLFTQERFDLVPIIDKHKKLKDVLLWEKVFGNGKKEKI